MTEDLGYGWQGDLVDLPAYLKRIGHDCDLAPTAGTLRALHRAHVMSIPFENLEIMLGRPIGLSLDAVQAKLVDAPRGGYCFEHNRLFAAVLERLGYEITALASRVMMGGQVLRPCSHVLLHVRPPDLPPDEPGWLCDVGFGGGPLEPLRFRDGEEAEQDGWGFRLAKEKATPTPWAEGGAEWALYQRLPKGWTRRQTFALNETFRIDFDVLNHYVSTNPRSPFTMRPFTQRFLPDVHYVLDGTTLTTTRPDGTVETRALAPGELPEVLASRFGIVLDSEDVPRLIAFLRA
ncbi:arylamine N-acetyltransferase family protein [Actinomadura livida]|uniref:Arylamine N-acetyltransferase n=1 Tax=Actinomadura livida TaxID=79909 RepID=A0A7W7N254_9ACTN|nr:MULTISPECIES: arylamine N-acetyltransferase [Actinomadura]MBB4778627.1 N-hydroxyarylamine O-acetyltransferase [Actinomadura catellatispora]GGU30394.1 putative arylamine n-acetyl transferase [Actinomadura livida]